MFREREPLSGVSRAVLSFLTTLLIILTVPSLFVIPAEAILFRPYSYQRALENQRFAERFPTLLAGAIINDDIPALEGNPQIAYFDRGQLAALLEGVFPPEWITRQTDGILQGAGDYVNFQRSDLALQVDMREVKDRLNGPEGAAIARQVVDTWPECSGEQLGQIMERALSGELSGIPVCRPPDTLRPAFEQVVALSLQIMANTLPDVVDLGSPLTNETVLAGVSGPLVPNWYGVFRAYAILRWLFRLLPVIALAVLLWIVLLTIRSLPDLFHAAGSPLLTAGLVGLGIGAVLLLVVNPLLARLVGNAFPLLPEVFRGVLTDVMHEVTNRQVIWSMFAALAVAGSGLALLIGSRIAEDEPVENV